MTTEELIKEIEDILILEADELDLHKPLESYDDWDSMSQLELIALFDTILDKKIDLEVLKNLKSTNDILDFVEQNNV